MNSLPGYQITEELQNSDRTVIYRGIRLSDQKPIIIKALKSEYPTLEEITRMRHEYLLAKNLEFEGIIKTYSLEKYKNTFALISEDIGGYSLKQFLEGKPLEVDKFLLIAIQISQALGELHRNQIIHKDIKPSNLIINPLTEQVKIADFSLASRLVRETPQLYCQTRLEGTLAYLSPEATGRMNRSIDYRSDFYALGVTFYEMLTGQLPFQTVDPLELIHCHIAVTPVPPHQLNPSISSAVSSIVMKLLAKNAEDRYQSALGLKSDLQICLTQKNNLGTVKSFIPGKLDRFGQFLIPQKLYGRTQEVSILMQSFEEISKGKTDMILVSGYSGVGKTSVINEIHKPIVAARGYFVAGKFDQFKRNIPYAALTQAFQSLVQQLLTETSDQITLWKEKILGKLGQNGQIIIDVIPEVELIIGSQPSLPEVSSAEAQNRFNRVLKEFIHVFTQPQHPLVLFLDDLQWADPASFKLLQILITDPESQYLLIIGAYRDNEVSATHPLVQTLEKIQECGASIKNIVLQPLAKEQVSQLVADTLVSGEPVSKNKLQSLVELLFHKTEGNPFFLTQILQALYSENLLSFDFNQGCWQWDIEQIKTVELSSCNVVELVVRNLQKLPKSAQQALQLAACIGNSFTLEVLAIVSHQSQSETATDLWSLLQSGFIIPLSDSYKTSMRLNTSEEAEMEEEIEKWVSERVVSDPLIQPQPNRCDTLSYKFVHDRVQQAAYSLIPDYQKKQIHLKIGNLLLQNTSALEIEENIFTLVNQFNIGIELITEPSEKIQLAKLNLIAGKKARLATAYEGASKYINIGLDLLPETAWHQNYDLMSKLHFEALELAYTNTHFERASRLSNILLSQTQSKIEKVKVYELESIFYFCQNQPQEALEVGLKALSLLGINLPDYPTKLDIFIALFQTKLQQGTKRIKELADGREMTEPEKLLAMRILLAISPAAFAIRPNLYLLVTLKMVNLSLKYGNTPLSSYGYGTYGLIHCAILGDIDAGYQYGQVSLKLLEQFNAQEFKATVFIPFYVFISHWKKHIKTNLEGLLEGIQAGLETGNIDYAGHCSAFYCNYLFLSGESLELVNKKQCDYVDFLVKYKQEFQVYQVKIWQQVSTILQGKLATVEQAVGENFDRDIMLSQLLKSKNGLIIFPAYLAKAFLSYWFRNYEECIANACEAEKYREAAVGSIFIPVHNFYYSLSLLALYSSRSKLQQRADLKKVEFHQKQMKKWATHCPVNYQHKYVLVEAEKARVLGQYEKAAKFYDEAIVQARKNDYIQEEALANELAANFYLSCDRENLGKLYLVDAYYGYLHWGAEVKAEELKSRYSQIFSSLGTRETPTSITTLSLSQKSSNSSQSISTLLDIASVAKASQAISEEIVLEKLLHKLMQILMENAGAQKGFLFLEKEGSWVLAAQGTVQPEIAIALPFLPISECTDLPFAVINYIQRTRQAVVLNNAMTEGLFANDLYTIKHQPKSVLGLPLIYQGKIASILYLENDLAQGAFTNERLEVLSILSTQASISLEKASVYNSLEQKVFQRTHELNEKNLFLEQALEQLKQAQIQLVQNEKMSSLGQLVAGIAHEINNPVNFIYGNLTHTDAYIKELLELIEIYQQYSDPLTPDIQNKIDEIDLDFLIEDLPKIISSMKIGAARIHEIVKSLRNFSRLDEAEMKPVNIHEGINNTLLILHNRLKSLSEGVAIEIIKEYGQLPLVECYASALNQVFINVLANAIDAIEQRYVTLKAQSLEGFIPQIKIETQVVDSQQVAIRIIDNGAGMTEEVKKRLFDPFFTTKAVGKGTGIGLSISYQIVVEKHGGQIQCDSKLEQGTEFVITIPLKQGAKSSCYEHSNLVQEEIFASKKR